jgi:hypothetical protein
VALDGASGRTKLLPVILLTYHSGSLQRDQIGGVAHIPAKLRIVEQR